MESFKLEKEVMKVVAGPVDLNTAAITGARVDFSKAKRILFLVVLGAGTATTDHVFTLKQHDAAAAGTSYDLEVANPYFHKIGAATVFTKVDVSVAAAAYDLHALLANSAAVVAFEVLPEQLRSDCRWVSMNVTDSGGAQLGTVIAIGDAVFLPAYSQAL